MDDVKIQDWVRVAKCGTPDDMRLVIFEAIHILENQEAMIRRLQGMLEGLEQVRKILLDDAAAKSLATTLSKMPLPAATRRIMKLTGLKVRDAANLARKLRGEPSPSETPEG